MKLFLSRFRSIRSFSSFSMNQSQLSLSQIDSYQRSSQNQILTSLFDEKTQTTTVTLEDTVLYPEGGGQPCDFGTVNGIPVIDVQKCPTGGINVKLNGRQTLVEGDQVESIVDWTRRYDFMQQHTAQHLFSALADQHFQADTVCWALGPDSVTVDLSVEKSRSCGAILSPEEIDRLEMETNLAIRAALSVGWKVINREELLPSSEPSPSTSNPAFSTSDLDLPLDLSLIRGSIKGAASELSSLRMISIQGLDLNPCGGTHLKNTAEIQMLKVLGCEKDRGALRVRFIAGDRVMRGYKDCLTREASLSRLLCSPPPTHLPLLQKLQSEKQDLSKSFKSCQDDLSSLLALSLSRSLPLLEPSSLTVHLSRPTCDLNFVLSLASQLSSLRPRALLYFSSDSSQLISSSSSSSNPNNSLSSSSSSKGTTNNNTKGGGGGGGGKGKDKKKEQSPIISSDADLEREVESLTQEILSQFSLSSSSSSSSPSSSTTTSTTSSSSSSASPTVEGLCVLIGPALLVNEVKGLVATAIQGRGGGPPGKWQGQGTALQNIDQVKNILHKFFKNNSNLSLDIVTSLSMISFLKNILIFKKNL